MDVMVHAYMACIDVVDNVENFSSRPVAGFTVFDNTIVTAVCGKVYQHPVEKYNIHYVCYQTLQLA